MICRLRLYDLRKQQTNNIWPTASARMNLTVLPLFSLQIVDLSLYLWAIIFFKLQFSSRRRLYISFARTCRLQIRHSMVKCLFAYSTCKEFPVLECYNLRQSILDQSCYSFYQSCKKKVESQVFGKFDNGSGRLVPANTDNCPG